MAQHSARRDAQDMDQVQNESDDDSGSSDSAEMMGSMGVVAVANGQDVDQVPGFQSPANVYVEAVIPKSFHNSLLRDLVPRDKWTLCEEDETEAMYVLEQVRQKLISLCAPGKGQWKVRSDLPGILFLCLEGDALQSITSMQPGRSYRLLRIPHHTSSVNQEVADDEKIMLKVIMGTVAFEIGGNRAPAAKVGVNAQIQIPCKTYFRIKNDEWDEALIFSVWEAKEL